MVPFVERCLQAPVGVATLAAFEKRHRSAVRHPVPEDAPDLSGRIDQIIRAGVTFVANDADGNVLESTFVGR